MSFDIGLARECTDTAPARADPRAEPAFYIVDPGVPGEPARGHRLLQRGCRNGARTAVRGKRRDVGRRLGAGVRADRRRGEPDSCRGPADDRRLAKESAGALPPPHPLAGGRQRIRGRGERRAGHRHGWLHGRDWLLLDRGRGPSVKVTVWGARGSIPAPGPETTRYGGNTSCVQVTLDDGSSFVLDAGTGIRSLGLALDGAAQPLNILLTHLHLDHIQGLMFFAPMFNPRSEIVVWGPSSREASLEDRIARYISAPLSPVEVRELPCNPAFREAETTEWRIGSAVIRAASVSHRGPTLGYRIEADGASLCYIPDHEPGLGVPLAELEEEWISGYELAHGSSLLIHDCQYTDDEYPHHIGWGHSPLSDALAFADRTDAERVMLFHHDPLHSDDFLDRLNGEVCSRMPAMARPTDWAMFATERQEYAP